MAMHDLKCWPEFFKPLLRGEKTAELRYNDRGYRAGDLLRIREWELDTERYTGRECKRVISHAVHGAGHAGAIAPLKGLGISYVVLSLREADDVDETGAAAAQAVGNDGVAMGEVEH